MGRHSGKFLPASGVSAWPASTPAQPPASRAAVGRQRYKGQAPQVYFQQAARPSETLPLWAWLLILLAVVVFFGLSSL